MPKNPEDMKRYETMLDQLAEEYPQVSELVDELSEELAMAMPGEEDEEFAPEEEDEFADDEDEELSEFPEEDEDEF